MIRSPDDAKIKQKMLFASSKDALRRALVGIAAEIQATDFSEVAEEVGACSLVLGLALSRLVLISLLCACSLACTVYEKVSKGN